MRNIETLEDLLAKQQAAPPQNMSTERTPAMEVEQSRNEQGQEKLDYKDPLNAYGDMGPPTARKLVRTEYDNVMKPNDSKIQRYLPSAKAAAKNVVGEIAPDFSGYDSLADRISKLQKEPHWAEILGGAVGSIAGLKYGQAGAGMKASGDALTGIAAKYDKKNDDIEKILFNSSLRERSLVTAAHFKLSSADNPPAAPFAMVAARSDTFGSCRSF